MKTRIAGRMRQVQGEKGMFVYRRASTALGDAVHRHPLRAYSKIPTSICKLVMSGVCPTCISRETYEFGKAYQLRKRQPEPTTMESIEVLTPARMED